MQEPYLRLGAAVPRRDFLKRSATGFGWLALCDLLANAQAGGPLAPKPPHFAPHAKRVIFLFMHGGPSQVDTFDYKPRLKRDHGKPLPFPKPRIVSSKTGNLLQSPFAFKQHGQSGAWMSTLFPHLSQWADHICFVKSAHGSNSRHGGALLELHTGSDTFVRPSMGSWIGYGLGTENQSLPNYITIRPTLTHGGVNSWSSAFLPAVYSGTPIGHTGLPIDRCKIPFTENRDTTPDLQRLELELARNLNEEQLDELGPESDLESRIQAFELAYRMQTEAPELQEITGESKATRRLYGLDDEKTRAFGRQCLMARRFSENGVRFVQASHTYKWDQHAHLTRDHARNAKEVDQPIAGLLRDLKARGLWDETLVLWSGEFGRTPVAQNDDGRDHNPHGFTLWLAGGGAKPGISYGATDDYGFYAVHNKVHFHDLHATMLYLLGLDHKRLTYEYGGRKFRLTDVHGRVVRDLIV